MARQTVQIYESVMMCAEYHHGRQHHKKQANQRAAVVARDMRTIISLELASVPSTNRKLLDEQVHQAI